MITIPAKYNLTVRRSLCALQENIALFFLLLAIFNFPYIDKCRLLFFDLWNSRVYGFITGHYPSSTFLGLFCITFIVLGLNDIVRFLKTYWLNLVAIFGTVSFLLFFDLSLPWKSDDRSILFCLIYLTWCLIRVRSKLKIFGQKRIALGLDDPLENPKDDLLNRASFAKNIFEVIKNLPESNTRIALSGEWGIGKTSCLNFISFFAREEDYPVVRFNPWKFSSKEEAWTGFIASVDAGISVWQGQTGSYLQRYNIANFLVHLFRAKIVSNEVGKVFDDLFLSRLRPSFEPTKEKLSEILITKLKGKKLVILIDDLDRAPAEVVYQVLLSIKEIIDVRGCVFVCGIDLKSTEIILKHYNIEAGKLFIEKIFQYLFEMPCPNSIESDLLLEQVLAGIKPSLKEEIIRKHKNLLPKNPRKLKTYLRTLSSLDGVLLKRFGQEDFLWEFLYLVELIKLRFPERIKIAVQQPSFFDWVANWYMWKINAEKEPANERVKEIQKWRDAFDQKNFPNDDSESEFELLLDALQSSGLGLTEAVIKSYFDVLAHVEHLTWKEYREWRKDGQEANLKRLLDKSIPFLVRREYLMALMREREKLLSHAADEWNHDKCTDSMRGAIELTEECLSIVKDEEFSKDAISLLDVALVKEWFGLLSKWAHFNKGDFYQKIRQLDKELSIELAKRTPHVASEILTSLRNFGDSRFLDYEKSFKDTADEVTKIYNVSLSKNLLTSFEQKNGIKALWGQDHFWPEKHLLFKPNPYFYSRENRVKLLRLAEQAKTDRIIQGNFHEFLRMLFYAITDPRGALESQPALEIVKDNELRELFWSAATYQRINRRSIGDFLKDRREIIVRLKSKHILPIPDWVKQSEPDLLEVFKLPENLEENVCLTN